MELSQKYAQALYELTKDKPKEEQESIFADFIKVLGEKGHSKLLPGILKNFERLVSEGESSYINFIVADEKAKDIYKSELKNYKDHLKQNLKVKIWLDKNIIGGFIIRTKDLIIDKSYKTALINLYNKAIK